MPGRKRISQKVASKLKSRRTAERLKQKRCGICKKIIKKKPFTLDCKHSFHNECIYNLYHSTGIRKCPVCEKNISKKKLNRLETCTICLESMQKDFLKLGCNHKMHKQCLKNYYNASRVAIKCPQCQVHLNSNIAKVFRVFPKYYNEYLKKADSPKHRVNDLFGSKTQEIKNSYDAEMNVRKSRVKNMLKNMANNNNENTHKRFLDLLTNHMYPLVIPKKSKIVKRIMVADINKLTTLLNQLQRYSIYDENQHYDRLADRDVYPEYISRASTPRSILKTNGGRQIKNTSKKWLYERFKYPVRNGNSMRVVNLRAQLV